MTSSSAHDPNRSSRLEDFGMLADRELFRRLALAMLAFGVLLEVMYSAFFEAPDWTDFVAVGQTLAAVVFVLLIPWDRVNARWLIVPALLGIAAVALIAIGDDVAIGMSFLFLPAAVLMVFYWDDLLARVAVMLPICVLYLLVPWLWGDSERLTEAVATLPLLIGSGIVLGMMFSRFRAASVEQARYRGTITALLMAIDARDDYSAAHSSDVLSLVLAVAEALELDEKQALHVADVALLHDVGKIGIPSEILVKPTTLTEEEWEVVRRHPVVGQRILSEVPGFEDVAGDVRHEHERWDGTGYPDGLAGEEIPIASRIVLACDAYRAMLSERPYRDVLSEEEARRELQEGAGSQFDPAVVKALIGELDARRRKEAV